MGRGKHSPPGDRSFAISAVLHLAGAVALVAAVAAAFWGLGQVQTVGDPVITEPVETPEPTPTELAEPADEADEPEPADEPDPADEADEPDAPADDGSDTVEDEPADDTDTDEEPADEDRAVEPSSVSIQVLDAAGDGGGRASFAATRLQSDGYRVVAENQAFRTYERTTVFYSSDGDRIAAQQVADEYGYAVVEPKPDNLSASVNLHVVIGQDHPTG